MNKIIWTPERILELQSLHRFCKDNEKEIATNQRKEIAALMDMSYNQINSALRRFCKEEVTK